MSAKIPNDIHLIYLEVIRERSFRNSSVIVIHEEATSRILAKEQWTEQDLPSLNWAYKAVKDARDRLTPDDKFLEQEWTLGSLASDNFRESTAVIKMLSELSRRAHVGGKVLTVRLAKWAAYLAAIFPDSVPHGRRLQDVWGWATEYSQEELAAKMLGVPFATAALDQQLSFQIGASDQRTEGWKKSEGRELLKISTPTLPSRLFSYSGALPKEFAKADLSQYSDSYAVLIVSKNYFDIHDSLIYWESELTAFEYDLAFLKLRTIKDDPANRWDELDDQQHLDLTERIACAIQSGNHEAFKEATTGISKQT